MAELRISVEKVCALIEAARELAGKAASTAGDRTTTGDDSELATIDEREGTGEDQDARRRETVEFIAGLNVDEQADLLALIWVGRGDYDIGDWPAAVAGAEARIARRDPDYMIGDPALPAYLGDGLEAFERACG